MNQFCKLIKNYLGLILLAFFVTNCSEKGMAFKTVEIVDAECINETGCASAASTVDVDDQTTQQTNQQGQAEFGPVAQDENLFNFVAGDKTSCELAIQSRLGVSHTCTLGGGCGQYCGIPSESCQSANPQLYGACIPY